MERMKTVSLKHWLAIAALGVVWGTTWVAADTLAEYVPPLLGSAARFLLAALLCTPVILWKRPTLPRGRALGFVFLLSVTMIALPFVLLVWAQPRVPSATVAVLFAAMPLLLTAISRRVPRSALQAAIVGLGAIALVVGASFSIDQAAGAAVVLLAVGLISASALMARNEFKAANPVMVTALLLGASAVLLFLASMALERRAQVQWNRDAIGAVIFLAAVAGAPAYATYFWLLQRLEAYQVATVQWIQPLVAISESSLFLHLGFSLTMIAGSMVTLVCLLIVARARAEDDNCVSLLSNS